MMKAWEPVAFFEAVCRDILEGYLYRHDFREIKTMALYGVVYANERVSLAFDYCFEDIPKYRLQIGVGLVSNTEAYQREATLGLWYLIPTDDTSAAYWDWTWSSPDELATVVTRVRDQVFSVYVIPLIENPDLIRKASLRRGKERLAKHEVHAVEVKRKKAGDAFAAGNFAEAIRIYRELQEIDMSPSDAKRLEIALKRVGSSHP